MKSLLYNLSIRSRIILVLTIFALFIITVFTSINIYTLRDEKRTEYIELLNSSKKDFLFEIEDLLERLSLIAKNRSDFPALIRNLHNGDYDTIGRMMDNMVSRLDIDGIGIIQNKSDILVFSTKVPGLREFLFSNIKPYVENSHRIPSGLCRINNPSINYLTAFAFSPVDSTVDMNLTVFVLKLLDEDLCKRISKFTGLNCTLWAGTESYATSESDEKGKMVFDRTIEQKELQRVFSERDTILIETDFLSKRDWSLISPVTCALGTTIGMFSISIDAQELAAEQWTIVYQELIIAGGIFLIILLISIFLAKSLTSPLKSFKEMAAEISVGRTDLPEFAITGRDELNTLKASFNRMIIERKQRLEREAAYQKSQRQRLTELAMLSEIATAVNVLQDLDEILKLILQKTAKAVEAHRGTIVLLDENQNIIKQINIGFSRNGLGNEYFSYIAEEIKREDGAVFLADTKESNAEVKQEEEYSNAFCIPLKNRDKLIGYICLFLDDSLDSLSEEQQRVLSIVSAHSVRVIENVRLYESERERERLQNEMSLARSIQSRLLVNTQPAIPKYDIFAHNTPSFEVSGDYFDIIQVSEKRYAISIGDVSGKGAAAALLMAYLQASVRAMLLDEQPLDKLVYKFNNLIFENTDASKFITYFITILDISNGELVYVNAGHNPPVLLRRDSAGETHEEFLKSGGPLLGGFKSMEYTSGKTVLNRHDILLLYTDGISEAMNANEEEYGEDRIMNELKNAGSKTAEEIKESLLASVKKFTNNRPQSDDMTLVVVKRKE